MTEPIEVVTTDYDKENFLLALKQHGHVNVEEFIETFKITKYGEPDTTYVRYYNFEGKEKVDPVDITHQELTLTRDSITQEQNDAMDEAWGLTPRD